LGKASAFMRKDFKLHILTESVNFFLIIILAFAPGAFWLWFFARKDRYDPEPKKRIAQTFFAGLLAVFPAAILELVGEKLIVPGGHWSLIVDSFLLIGVSEELFKFLAVYLWAYRKSDFNEVMDGITYAASSSLGFASLENLFYTYQMPSIIISRALFSTLGHVLFSMFWGYPLGLVKMRMKKGRIILWGLLLSAFLHGLYDVLLFSENLCLASLVIPLLVALYLIAGRRIKRSLASSAFRWRCLKCGFVNGEGSTYCANCGERIEG